MLNQLHANFPTIFCKAEMIFPPAFFDIIVHLTIHLPDEALLAGPVQYRWMCPFERYLGNFKHYVRNKTHPEGSIVEGYVHVECLTFCSMYLNDIETRYHRPERNSDLIEPPSSHLSVFSQKVHPLGASNAHILEETLFERAN